MVGQELTIGALLSARTDWLAFCKSDQAAKPFYISARQAPRRLRLWKYQNNKMRPYECGIDPETGAHDRFTVRYYIVAMLFLIFDVETIFLLPWAIIFMGNDFSFTKFALVEMFVFIGILVVG